MVSKTHSSIIVMHLNVLRHEQAAFQSSHNFKKLCIYWKGSCNYGTKLYFNLMSN